MEKILLTKENGHEVPCIAEFPAAADDGPENPEKQHPRKLVIVIHGYDSSKESENAANLMRILPGKGFGVVAYDQPNHGSAQAAEEELSIEACLDSLAAVEQSLRARFPGVEICYFGSSFGAYILGIYLVRRKGKSCNDFGATGNDASAAVSTDTTSDAKPIKAFMRCAAVNFPELDIDERARRLEPVDLFELFEKEKPENVRFAFAHGECDSSVPVEAAIEFAQRFGYPITVFPGEEHPICTYPESPGKVAELAIALFN